MLNKYLLNERIFQFCLIVIVCLMKKDNLCLLSASQFPYLHPREFALLLWSWHLGLPLSLKDSMLLFLMFNRLHILNERDWHVCSECQMKNYLDTWLPWVPNPQVCLEREIKEISKSLAPDSVSITWYFPRVDTYLTTLRSKKKTFPLTFYVLGWETSWNKNDRLTREK